MANKATHRDLGAEEFLEHELLLIASPGYTALEKSAISLNDLKGMELLLAEEGTGIRTILEAMVSRKGMKLRDFNIITVSGSNGVIRNMVKNGMGISPFPRAIVQRELDVGDFRAFHLEDGELRYKFYLVYRKQDLLPLKTRRFLETGKKLLRKEL